MRRRSKTFAHQARKTHVTNGRNERKGLVANIGVTGRGAGAWNVPVFAVTCAVEESPIRCPNGVMQMWTDGLHRVRREASK